MLKANAFLRDISTGRASDSPAKQEKASSFRMRLLLSWHRPIFPGRRQPSIFGTDELNYRVRNGNGWTLIVINTNRCVVSLIRGDAYYYITGFYKLQALFSKKFLFSRAFFPQFQMPVQNRFEPPSPFAHLQLCFPGLKPAETRSEPSQPSSCSPRRQIKPQ